MPCCERRQTTGTGLSEHDSDIYSFAAAGTGEEGQAWPGLNGGVGASAKVKVYKTPEGNLSFSKTIQKQNLNLVLTCVIKDRDDKNIASKNY